MQDGLHMFGFDDTSDALAPYLGKRETQIANLLLRRPSVNMPNSSPSTTRYCKRMACQKLFMKCHIMERSIS